MKKANSLIPILSATVLLGLTGCGYIKSLFPDKEKDYQYTTEIPELVIPAGLGKNEGPKLTAPSPAVNQAVEAPAPSAPRNIPTEKTAARVEPVTGNQPAESPITITPIEDKPAIVDNPIDNTIDETATEATPTLDTTKASEAKHEIIPVELIKAADGQNRLRLGVPFEKAWRTVDKALSRKSLEVTDRDKQESIFKLNYDPNEKKLEDGSLWDEAIFLFSGFQSNEEEFLVKLIANGQQTDVVILDTELQPATDAAALKLLNLLQETIKTDFAK